MKFTKEVRMRDVKNSGIFIFQRSVYIKQEGKTYRMRTGDCVTIPDSHLVNTINNMDIADLCSIIIGMKDKEL
jgi:hypothetical protein